MSKKLLNVYTILALYCVAWLLLTNICTNDSRYQDAPSYYSVLGVPNNAPPDVISEAYHNAAKEVRRIQQKEGLPEAEAKEKQANLLAAYETLSNPSRRREHDAIVCAHVKCPAVFVPCAENEEPRGCCPCQKPLGNRGFMVSWMKQDTGFWGLLYNWGPVVCCFAVLLTGMMAWWKTKQIEKLRSRASAVAQQRQQLWEERREQDRARLEEQAREAEMAREREREERRAARDEKRRQRMAEERAMKESVMEARERQQREAEESARRQAEREAQADLTRRRSQRQRYTDFVGGSSSSRGKGYVLGSGEE